MIVPYHLKYTHVTDAVTAIGRNDARGLPAVGGRRVRYHFGKGKGVLAIKKRELRFSRAHSRH